MEGGALADLVGCLLGVDEQCDAARLAADRACWSRTLLETVLGMRALFDRDRLRVAELGDVETQPGEALGALPDGGLRRSDTSLGGEKVGLGHAQAPPRTPRAAAEEQPAGSSDSGTVSSETGTSAGAASQSRPGSSGSGGRVVVVVDDDVVGGIRLRHPRRRRPALTLLLRLGRASSNERANAPRAPWSRRSASSRSAVGAQRLA